MSTASATTSSMSRLGTGWTMPDLQVVESDGPEHYTADGGAYCATCRGARWLKARDFDPRRASRDRPMLVRCPDCQDSQRAARLNRLAAIAGLDDEQRRKTFNALDPVRGIGEVVKAASEFAALPDGWLVIYGAPGSGKTHLGLAVANALIAREQSVIWRYVPRLVFDLRQQVARASPDEITPLLVDAPVLILDELGGARPTDYLIETLELVFDSRYQRRLPTLVTLIGDLGAMRSPGYEVAEDIKGRLSVAIGRRMQDPSVCRIVRNAAPQWGVKAAPVRAGRGEG